MNFNDIINTVSEDNYSAFYYTPVIYRKAKSYILLRPKEIITIHKKDDLNLWFKRIQKLINKGYYGYALIKYEAGFLFEPKLESLLQPNHKNLIQFIFFEDDQVKEVKSSEIIMDPIEDEKYKIKNFSLSRSEDQFKSDVLKIKNFIKEGDTYQVNYTVKGNFIFFGSYSAFFKKLIFNQSARYSALINTGDELIFSLSPELFFFKKKRNIISIPMKGTIRRGISLHSDMNAEKELLNSEKNRAENVMIVDLIRNDLGRICKYGSIKVQELFSVEKYESLFQMVSKIKGELRKNTSLLEIIKNVFPCGSITGAPKIRTMEIINEIEKDTRGIYTGSIALIAENKIKMNVAIRTITLNKSTREGHMGLGSGIVWDSDPRGEYEEVLLKSKFLTEPENYFDLFESMRLEKGEIKFLDYHLNRLKTGADFFQFRFSKSKALRFVRDNISALGADLNSLKKVKLSLNKWGGLKIDVSELPKSKDEIYVILSQNRIKSEDKFRNFKTTNRKMYDDEYNVYSKQGFYEVIYLNEKGSLAEGSRTNIFFRQGDNWFTPPIDAGVLPGIYRNYFIYQHPNTIEKDIGPEQLKNFNEMVLTNAVRGTVTVKKIFYNLNEYILLGKQQRSTREIEFKI